jgi:hypothetical protein
MKSNAKFVQRPDAEMEQRSSTFLLETARLGLSLGFYPRNGGPVE